MSDSKECGNTFRTAEMRIGVASLEEPRGCRGQGEMGTEPLWP